MRKSVKFPFTYIAQCNAIATEQAPFDLQESLSLKELNDSFSRHF